MSQERKSLVLWLRDESPSHSAALLISAVLVDEMARGLEAALE